MRTRSSILIILASVLLCAPVSVRAQKPRKGPGTLAKTTTNDVYRPLLINNVFNYYANNGDGAYNRYSANNEGFESPKGSDLATAVFEEGIMWGCYQAGQLKVGGSYYRHGLQAGAILVNGTPSTAPVADDPASPANRVYRVRRDVKPIPGVADPADPLAAVERWIIQQSEVALIGRYEAVTAEQLLQQYWADWNEWPAAQGAPYTDVDHNGVYDPSVDIPGVPHADQTLWYVANDLNPTRVFNFIGSSPIGIEMQRTIWAYNVPGPLNTTIFTGTRLINKNSYRLDSVFVAQWSDPDVGAMGDDYAGCDTLLNLGYAYNGSPHDANFLTYGLPPPAVGYDIVQGPIVPGTPSDTALYDHGYRPGYRNLPMTGFAFFAEGNASYADPTSGPTQYVEAYHVMKGTSTMGVPFIDPVTHLPTTYCLSGDPTVGQGRSGWVDGMIGLPPGDRRILVSTGPFTLAAGDTQEVVVACLSATGADNLSSVSALKAADRAVQQAYNTMFSALPPQLSSTVGRSGDQATVSFRADARDVHATAVKVILKAYDEIAVDSVALQDDGLHNDGAAADRIFGGSVQIPQRAVGLNAQAVVNYPDGGSVTWPHMVDDITTALLHVTSFAVVSDNINNNGVPNPGENVRYVFTMKNTSSFSLTDIAVTPVPASRSTQLAIPSLAGNATASLSYDPDNPASYMAFDIPAGYPDTSFTVILITHDRSRNLWKDTLSFPVRPLTSGVYGSPAQHTAGSASGDLTIRIVDSGRVKDHLYVVRGAYRGADSSGYSVKDSTTGVVLVKDHPLPDSLGHTSPIIDGFKVLLGTVDPRIGMRSWSVPQGTRRFSPVGGCVGVGLEGLSMIPDTSAYDQAAGTIGAASHFMFGGIGTNLRSSYHTVVLKLAAVNNVALWDPRAVLADTNFSRAYRYLGNAMEPPATASFAPWIVHPDTGYPYQDYTYAVPFSAWDVDVDPPVRLAVGMLENNATGGFVDGRYWPGSTIVDNAVAEEFGFIFKSPYTTTPDPALAVNLRNNASIPLMWVMTCSRRAEVPWVSGDQFEIVANHLPGPSDAWTFNPTVAVGLPAVEKPVTFALLQNFPNPFNPGTEIRYSLPHTDHVRLVVYDLLGREVAVLVNGTGTAGEHAVRFDGSRYASGVYFYRIETGGFVRTQKMVLLR